MLITRFCIAICCFTFSVFSLAVPTASHISGGVEHIVLVDRSHPTPPEVEEVLSRLSLHVDHPDVRHVFNNSRFTGFAASMKSHCLDLLSGMKDISIVEQKVQISASQLNPRSELTYSSRIDSPWGLQRISSSTSIKGSPTDMSFMYSYTGATLGEGADIYVLDTGIFTAHQAFTGRAQMLWSFDNDTTDRDGHGTHVAGTAGGQIFGVASSANLLGIKALDSTGGGWSSDVIAGIDYIIQRHESRLSSNLTSDSDSPFIGSILSMSFSSSSPIPSLNTAITAALTAGIHVVSAAGNSGVDACTTSPASTGGSNGPGAITVGAIDTTSARPSFSNYGSCVDVYAPGVDILSAWIDSDDVPPRTDMINLLAGTSMSAPHVAGIVACAMAANATLAGDVGLMKEWVLSMATPGEEDGVLVANNGVLADVGAGLLGLRKEGGRPVAWRKVRGH